MYISSKQIEASLEGVAHINPFYGTAFLAFKKAGLPVGETVELTFSQIADDILKSYYQPASSYEGFFQPFHTSDKLNRWVSRRYASTSLQRITADTFGDCLIHSKKSAHWGWRENYVQGLKDHLQGSLIPAFHLAVWLFRAVDWPAQVDTTSIRDRLFTEFFITPEERRELFELSIDDKLVSGWLQPDVVSEVQLSGIIGAAKGAAPEEGAALRLLEINQIGPVTKLRYEPAERLNLITGDNSLGKTFLLECVWWALTGSWIDQPALPRRDVPKHQPKLSFVLTAANRKVHPTSVGYSWQDQAWSKPASRDVLAGLVVYARYDGSFAVWDPARSETRKSHDSDERLIFFDRQQVWDGLSSKTSAVRSSWICNGILIDWLTWQTGGKRHESQYNAFVAAMRGLSPSGVERLEPGEPLRVPREAREIPTLRMPYGDVPITQASAGVQRIVALAYLLVWSWFEHVSLSLLARKTPQRRIVLIVDEVEAHLHPRWQRLIVPALMGVVSELALNVSLQVHLATHSPLIMASAEPIFDEKQDGLQHLKLSGLNVVLDELPFRKRGRADLWLISEVFGLEQARSVQGENVIRQAKDLQRMDSPDVSEISKVHTALVKLLPQDDEFWPRWTYFAEKHGVTI